MVATTHVKPYPDKRFPFPTYEIARVHRTTGQLVVFDAPGGCPPPPEVVARM